MTFNTLMTLVGGLWTGIPLSQLALRYARHINPESVLCDESIRKIVIMTVIISSLILCGLVTVALILIYTFVPYNGMNMFDVLGHGGWLNLSNLMLLITLELLAINVVVAITKYRASQRPGSKYSDPLVFKVYTRKMMNLLYIVIALTIGIYCLLKYAVF